MPKEGCPLKILENTIINFKKADGSEILERILWISSDRSEVVLVNIDNEDQMVFPYFRGYNDLESQIDEGYARIIRIDPDIRMLAPEESYLQKHMASRDRKWEIIKDIVHQEPEIYIDKSRGKLVRDTCEKHEIAKKLVYDYLKRFWFYGKSINGLLNNYYACGYPETADRKANPGRKPESGSGYIITDEDKEKFKKAIDNIYSEGTSLSATYKQMQQEEYNEGYYRKHGVKVPVVNPENCPSERQFRYWFENEYGKKQKTEKRYGKRKAEMNARALVGNPAEDIQGPGALYEIDSTPADVLLLANDRKTVIGRAHVYFTKDIMSRIIAGMHVCRNEAWEEAMVALENASSDKVEYCTKYGITIEEDEWPCKHLPKFIAADRGEMKSQYANNLVNINVQVGNAPSGRGDLKPYIEQQFRRFNARIRELLPGAVIKHKEPGDKEPKNYACLTFEEFTKFVILFVLEFNQSILSDNYFMTKELFAEKVELTPLGVWTWGNGRNLLHEKPRNLIRYSLLPKGEGTVTRAGLIFEKLAYKSDRGMDEGWFEEERIDGKKKVEVCFDPRNCSSIFIKLKEGMFEQLFLTAAFREYEGMHFDDVKIMLKYKKQQLAKGKKEQTNVEAILNSVAKSMVKESESKAKEATIGRPRNAKFKNMRIVRKMDKRMDSSKAAWTAVKQTESKTVEKQSAPAEVIPFKSTEKSESKQYKQQNINNMQLFLLSKNEERRMKRD